MSDDYQERRSVFYPFGLVGAATIPAVVLILMGAAQFFAMPQGTGMPIDKNFWHPLIPFGILSAVGIVVGGVFWGLKSFRDVFFGIGILFGGGTIGFGMMMFALAERESLEAYVQEVPAEKNLTCMRRASDGKYVCVDENGQADAGYTATVVTR